MAISLSHTEYRLGQSSGCRNDTTCGLRDLESFSLSAPAVWRERPQNYSIRVVFNYPHRPRSRLPDPEFGFRVKVFNGRDNSQNVPGTSQPYVCDNLILPCESLRHA